MTKKPTTTEHTLPPDQQAVFVSTEDTRWEGLATRFQREKGYPPPNSTKAGPGWYFPRHWFPRPGWEREA